MKIRKLSAALVTAAAVLATAPSMAKDWPTQPVRMIVGYSAGGTTDLVARILSEPLAKELGTSVVVENRPGAGGAIGAAAVVNAPPDGYTFLFAASPEIAIAPAIGQKTPYNVRKDLKPLALICLIPHVLVVNSSVPANSVAELRALVKEQPGKLNFASYGNGTSNHLMAELFKAETGMDIVHIPFKGSAPAMVDLLGGRVQMMFDTEAAVLKHVQAGNLKALGYAHKTRSLVLPDVPTMDEAGVPGFVGGSWVGLLAPAGVPDDVAAKVSKGLMSVLESPTIQKVLKDRGLSSCAGSTPQEFSTFIDKEISKWTDVAKRANISVQ